MGDHEGAFIIGRDSSKDMKLMSTIEHLLNQDENSGDIIQLDHRSSTGAASSSAASASVGMFTKQSGNSRHLKAGGGTAGNKMFRSYQ